MRVFESLLVPMADPEQARSLAIARAIITTRKSQAVLAKLRSGHFVGLMA